MSQLQIISPTSSSPQACLTDTHCHIHDREFFPNGGEDEYQRALETGVGRLICVGTDPNSSQAAVEFARQHENAFASVGIHPHDAKLGLGAVEKLQLLLKSTTQEASKGIVAIGEIGLDYYYDNSPRDQQRDMFMAQLELAKKFDLPVSFHARKSFDDFFFFFF